MKKLFLKKPVPLGVNMLGDKKALGIWCLLMMVLTALMVLVGGVTRLTHSGLSMVEWKPLLGAIPPLSEAAWMSVFEKYKAYPEYLKLNVGMSLWEFKKIFFWEYLHRVLGRIIGLVILLPYLYFLLAKKLTPRLKKVGALMVVLVVLQGIMGWVMVSSGLIDNPAVSHYRLAIHLFLAFLLFLCVLWEYLTLFPKLHTAKNPLYKKLLIIFLCIIVLQVIYGAFVAGLKAGFGFNTFPKMGDSWLPVIVSPDSLSSLIISHPVMVQFIHRCLGWLIVIFSVGLWIFKPTWGLSHNRPLLLITLTTISQFLLGVLTLVTVVQIEWAVIHQLGALLLLSTVLYQLKRLS